MIPVRAATVEAPAKINLGLEILGKRPDGFHEIRSLLVMLDFADTVRLTVGRDDSGQELPGISADENLIGQALDAFRRAVPGSPAIGWSVEKRIPEAAGLGGASSDAAAALLAANDLLGAPLTNAELVRLAATLGSDIPFFLGTPAAVASGRGTNLAPLPAIDAPVSLLLPSASIARKTQTLYSMIVRDDLSDGARIEQGRRAVERGSMPGRAALTNAFSRPLSHLVPISKDLRKLMDEHGVEQFGLSGAGPVHYVIGKASCDTLDLALAVDRRLEAFTVIRTGTRRMPITVVASSIDA